MIHIGSVQERPYLLCVGAGHGAAHVDAHREDPRIRAREGPELATALHRPLLLRLGGEDDQHLQGMI